MNHISLPQFVSRCSLGLRWPLPALVSALFSSHTHTQMKCDSQYWDTVFHLCPPYRSWRLVSSRLRQIPVVGGGPGEADPNHSRGHAGTIRQLWLADGLPVDVQWHRTQLETTQTGGQLRGNSLSIMMISNQFSLTGNWQHEDIKFVFAFKLQIHFESYMHFMLMHLLKETKLSHVPNLLDHSAAVQTPNLCKQIIFYLIWFIWTSRWYKSG